MRLAFLLLAWLAAASAHAPSGPIFAPDGRQIRFSVLSALPRGGQTLKPTNSAFLPPPRVVHVPSAAPPAGALKGPHAAASSHHAHPSSSHLMSPPIFFLNLLADLTPHGMLPLAYGIAAGGGTGLAPALGIMALFALLSWYGLISYARAGEVVGLEVGGSDTISAVTSKLFSPSSIPSLLSFFLTFGCCLFYSAFLGDIFAPLANLFLPSSVTSRLGGSLRSAVILTLTVLPLLPLCLLEDLSSLFYSSCFGLFGVLYTMLFILYRAHDGSYSPPAGRFYTLMKSLGPHFERVLPRLQPVALANAPPLLATDSGVPTAAKFLLHTPLFQISRGTLTLMNMCCVAFACHYNAVKYNLEYSNRLGFQKGVPTYGSAVSVALVATLAVFVLTMVGGYKAFGAASQPLVLNGFHPTADLGATLARALTGIAILGGYPLMYAGLKAALFDLFQPRAGAAAAPSTAANLSPRRKTALSVALLAAINGLACFVTEHELGAVLGVVGAVLGGSVVYVLPAIVNLKVLEGKDKGGKGVRPMFRGERNANYALGVFGAALMVLGTWVSLNEGGDAGHH